MPDNFNQNFQNQPTSFQNQPSSFQNQASAFQGQQDSFQNQASAFQSQQDSFQNQPRRGWPSCPPCPPCRCDCRQCWRWGGNWNRPWDNQGGQPPRR